MNAAGEVIGIIGISMDITELKQAEDKIRIKNEELVKINLEKDKFFSIIAHDLRNPFNSFLGLTKLMVEDLPTMDSDDIRSIALTMSNSAKNLYNLLEELLSWSSIQIGSTNIDPVEFSVMSHIVEILQPVFEMAEKKNIGISYVIPDDLKAYADISIVGSVVRNLTTNAIKFTPRGGGITISANPSNVNTVEISVKDTGIGMSKEILDNLFCLDNNTNRKGTEGEPSTGLGLIICKDFVEKHGGRLWVESEEGKGSTFYFTLPRSRIN
jgi:signal transduction histidine kinase